MSRTRKANSSSGTQTTVPAEERRSPLPQSKAAPGPETGGDMTGLTREDIIAKACELGFEDVGFTTAEPFGTHLDFLKDREDEYGWAEATGLKLEG